MIPVSDLTNQNSGGKRFLRRGSLPGYNSTHINNIPADTEEQPSKDESEEDIVEEE